jgi:hypothetical protein
MIGPLGDVAGLICMIFPWITTVEFTLLVFISRIRATLFEFCACDIREMCNIATRVNITGNIP